MTAGPVRGVALIVNLSAGGGRAARVLPAVKDALAARRVPTRTERTSSLAHAGDLARQAADHGEVAAALGGDGLVGAVAGALSEHGGVLGVLPGGRGNDFARTIGIPRDPAAAASVLATGREAVLDLAEAGGRRFVGIASCGFDSDANRIANEAHVVLGKLVYLYGALRALAAWRPARFELELDGAPRALTGYSVAAANAKAYGGGMYLAPEASLEDGLLDVVTVADMPKRRFLARLPKVYAGRHVENSEVVVERAREVRVSADRPFALYADGDPIATLPVTIRALPGAVRVIVPA